MWVVFWGTGGCVAFLVCLSTSFLVQHISCLSSRINLFLQDALVSFYWRMALETTIWALGTLIARAQIVVSNASLLLTEQRNIQTYV